MKNNPISSTEALSLLKEGNARFVEGRLETPNRDAERRILTSRDGQNPFAAILACSDSRVPVAAIFDRGVGDIFTIRVAGNVVGEIGTGSIEYAVKHLGTGVFVVLGHSCCGAVQAAIAEGDHSHCVNKLIEKITPAVQKAKASNPEITGNDLSDEVARTNVWLQAEYLFENNSIVREAVESQRLILVAAFYDIRTGKVEWMGQYPEEDHLLRNLVIRDEYTPQDTTRA